jgi:hypothetical protein
MGNTKIQLIQPSNQRKRMVSEIIKRCKIYSLVMAVIKYSTEMLLIWNISSESHVFFKEYLRR